MSRTQTVAGGDPIPKPGVPLLFVIFCATAVLVIWQLTFVGFTASDDFSYLSAARGRLHDFLFVWDDGWSPRHTVVFPIAASIGIFGETEWALTLPTLFYQIGIVTVGGFFVRHVAGTRAGLITAALLATLPLLAIQSSIASADTAELFFVVLSLSLFLLAVEHRGRTSLLLGAGLAAGFAVMTRETSGGLLLLYSVLFLIGFGMGRTRYFVLAAGFLFIQGADMLYYALMTGDPLYRLHVDLGVVARDHQTLSRSPLPKLGYDKTGAFRVNALIDPLVMIFSRIDFGLLSYTAIPAAAWAATARREQGSAERAARVFLLAGLAWLAFNSLALRTELVLPRYYSVCALSMAVIIGIWLGRIVWPRHDRRAAAVLGLLLGVNLLGLYLVNKEPLYGPRALVTYLSSTDGPVVTIDPEFAARSKTLLEWAGLSSRVKTTRPSAGDIVVNDPFVFTQEWLLSGAEARKAEFKPGPNWQPIWRRQEDRRLAGIVLERWGVAKFLPPLIYSKFDHPHPTITAYRVSPSR